MNNIKLICTTDYEQQYIHLLLFLRRSKNLNVWIEAGLEQMIYPFVLTP